MPPSENERRPLARSGAHNQHFGNVRITDHGSPCVIPEALRGARLVPRQAPGGRAPLRVTAGAFTAAGMPVPDDPGRRNAYQLSGRLGWPWSPALDRHTGARGAEIQPGSGLLCADCDTELDVSGAVWLDGLRRLADLAAESGEVLDLSGCVAVRTPGNGAHGPGWHLWFRENPDYPVHPGPLARCRAVELKTRCTAPGSPGYQVRGEPPAELAVIPRWLASLAARPRVPAASRARESDAWGRRRLEAVIEHLRLLRHGDHRNNALYWAACRFAEAVRTGVIDAATAERALFAAAEENGHVGKRGAGATLATIRQGLRQAAAA